MSATANKLAVIEALIAAKKKPAQDNSVEVKRMAEQAIASMRDAINHNDAVMGEVIKRLTSRPARFDITRDSRGNMVSITPIYDKIRP